MGDRNDWLRYIGDQLDFDRFVANVAYIVACELVFCCCYCLSDSASLAVTGNLPDEEVAALFPVAKNYLDHILPLPRHPDLARTLSLLPHFTKDPTLRQSIVNPFGVSSGLIHLLTGSPGDIFGIG